MICRNRKKSKKVQHEEKPKEKQREDGMTKKGQEGRSATKRTSCT
jgi:hypothetical protein